VGAREDMHIAAKRGHDVTGPSCRSWSVPQNTAPGRYILAQDQVMTSCHAADSVGGPGFSARPWPFLRAV
jgi:hypothetical protein